MRRSLAALGGLMLLAGCQSAARISAVITGGAAGAASGNPAVGFAAAVATDAAASWAVRYVARVRQGAEQDAIAAVAGQMPMGAEADWKIEHTIPIGDEHGRLRIVRDIDTQLATCREIAFSVDSGKGDKRKGSWFVGDICRQAAQWKWASAEPAVARWGYLQ
ncbi:MAG TPA: hypothetical protein VHB27_07940 [Rhodopila sp.]|uniref:hypothetical protein n=1 Tax=Rhodopila sp. TaxID=2480087 RepID=UPI002B8B6FB9|nr:hypothetical protein [Rhodopila sp.]HVY15141.1 hypothetical protein [Rhodopila sp.]